MLHSSPPSEKQAWFQDGEHDLWYEFSGFIEEVEVFDLQELENSLKDLSERVGNSGIYALLWISYEAGAAFDKAFPEKNSTELPLLYAQLFKTRTAHKSLPESSRGIAGISNEEIASLHWRQKEDANSYANKLKTVQKHIQNGDSYQVNFTFQQECNSSLSAKALFQRLAQSGCSKYAAFMEHSRFSLLSFSPELFFRLKGNEILTEPMKGTSPRGLSHAGDIRLRRNLAKSEKDRAENVMIVDLLRNDLSRIAEKASVRTQQMFRVSRLPNVWQMTSQVKAKTRASISEIFKALFPCASVTGAPKASTMKIIDSLESSNRGIYTGSIGFLAPGREALFNVAIRSLLYDQEKRILSLGSGSGVTAASNTASEYRECVKKASFVQTEVPDFSLIETLLWKPESGFWLLPYHIKRMLRSARYFGFPLKAETLQRALKHSIPISSNSEHLVRCLCNSKGELHLESKEFQSEDRPWKLELSGSPVNSKDMFLYHKTTRRSVYEERAQEHPDADEVILYNEHGEITEGCRSNIALRFADKWLTPRISCGLLDGTYRESLLREGKLEEAKVQIDDLQEADEIAVLNSVRGWVEIASFAGSNRRSTPLHQASEL